MRKAGSSRGAVSAYPRQLEALIRLSEAHAKMRLVNILQLILIFFFCNGRRNAYRHCHLLFRFSEFVEVADVEEAKR